MQIHSLGANVTTFLRSCYRENIFFWNTKVVFAYLPFFTIKYRNKYSCICIMQLPFLFKGEKSIPLKKEKEKEEEEEEKKWLSFPYN